jgi:hypothetical protein
VSSLPETALSAAPEQLGSVWPVRAGESPARAGRLEAAKTAERIKIVFKAFITLSLFLSIVS